MSTRESLYDILEVSRDISQEDLKKQYRKLALKHHPDKHASDPEARQKAEATFKKISEAYAVLSDENKRQQYDQFGTVEDIPPMPDMNDIFSQMFGNFAGRDPFSFMFGGPQHQQNSIEVVKVGITLQEVYNGAKKTVSFNVNEECSTCNGTGAQDGESSIINCLVCKGRGVITHQLAPFMITQQTCPSCNGNGKMIKDGKKCTTCNGNKLCSNTKSVDIKLPRGIPNNYQHKLDSKGSYNVNTKKNNDVVFLFNYIYPKDHNINSIDDDGNIHVTIDIKLDELLCGFKRVLNIYGKDLVMYSKGYINPSKKIVLRKHGLPIYKKDVCGDLIISISVVYTDDVNKFNKYHDVFLKIFKKHDENIDENTSIILQ